jgi:CheY-like chemotaxis protein
MYNEKVGKPIEILLVEDNAADVRLTREAFDDAKVLNNLNVVGDGVEAMEYLRREGKYADAIRPDLVLLDLNMPRKDGREVLAEVKGDPDLMRIPVVILTVSKAEEDVLKSYNLHANCYISKPVNLAQFLKVVESIENFWLTIVELPPNGKAPGKKKA